MHRKCPLNIPAKRINQFSWYIIGSILMRKLNYCIQVCWWHVLHLIVVRSVVGYWIIKMWQSIWMRIWENYAFEHFNCETPKRSMIVKFGDKELIEWQYQTVHLRVLNIIATLWTTIVYIVYINKRDINFLKNPICKRELISTWTPENLALISGPSL